jgi:Ala-tRNA(Pro) deacylase
MWGDNLKKYLDEQGVKYVTIRHSPAYTAQEIAASAHIPGQNVAKTVMVKLDGRLAMVVLPAADRVIFDLLAQATGARRAELAREPEFADLFPECERGAMPPFGHLAKLDVYVADDLAEDEDIAFNACSFTELIKMAYADFTRLVHPKVLHLSAHV